MTTPAPLTPLEWVGLFLVAFGIAGVLDLAIELWREHGKPAHDHPEGLGRASCPRCAWDRAR